MWLPAEGAVVMMQITITMMMMMIAMVKITMMYDDDSMESPKG